MILTLFIARKFSNNSTLRFSAILILSYIFCSSCSKSNTNPSKNNIVGKWYIIADTARLYTWPGNQFIEILQTDVNASSFVQYNADGSGASHISSADSSNFT